MSERHLCMPVSAEGSRSLLLLALVPFNYAKGCPSRGTGSGLTVAKVVLPTSPLLVCRSGSAGAGKVCSARFIQNAEAVGNRAVCSLVLGPKAGSGPDSALVSTTSLSPASITAVESGATVIRAAGRERGRTISAESEAAVQTPPVTRPTANVPISCPARGLMPTWSMPARRV